MQFKSEIKISKRDSMVEISQTMMGETKTILLSNGNVREVLVWMKKEMPDTMREIFCEDCPEVLSNGT